MFPLVATVASSACFTQTRRTISAVSRFCPASPSFVPSVAAVQRFPAVNKTKSIVGGVKVRGRAK